MSDNKKKPAPTDPQRRLLEAMVILHARRNGRPIPDMKNIIGFTVKVTPSDSRDEMRHKIIKGLNSIGAKVTSGKQENS